ncbi:MAG: hypothetical protein ACPG31_13295 [Planctomycetota bacterium]
MRLILCILLAIPFWGTSVHAQQLRSSDWVANSTASIEILEAAQNQVLCLRLSLGFRRHLDPIARRTDASGTATWNLHLPAGLIGRKLQMEVLAQQQGSFTVLATAAMTVMAFPEGPMRLESDLFQSPRLDPSWTVYNGHMANITQVDGALHIVPILSGGSATWYNDDEAVYVYKMFTGDFDIRANAHARSSLTPGANVPINYRLGGLMVRDPNSIPGNRNSAHVALGSGVSSTPIAVEDKTTTASNSDFLLYPIPTMDLELRMTRVGDLIGLWYRLPGTGSWILLRSHLHPEFPAAVQVGMMAYSNNSPADIDAWFDDIRFY